MVVPRIGVSANPSCWVADVPRPAPPVIRACFLRAPDHAVFRTFRLLLGWKFRRWQLIALASIVDLEPVGRVDVSARECSANCDRKH
jgi:hypothetical protein